jgi:hypothetical protein
MAGAFRGRFGAAFVLVLIGLVACGGGGGGSVAVAPSMQGATPMPSPNPSATFTPLPNLSGSASTIASFALGGGEQSVLPAGTVASPYVPDEQMPYLRQPDGTFKLWASAGGTFGTYLFDTPDLFSLAAPSTVFLPAGAGTPAFDADYAGPGSVFPAANGTDLLMIYHAENHLFSGVDYAGTPFYAGIGLARSSDGGLTWQRQGEIISGHDPQQATQPPSGAGALTPSAIEIGGYVYVCFRELDLQSNVSGYALARAPISSDGAPGSWQKYYQGSFSSPGLGGAFTPLNIVLDPTVPGDERQPNISFNAYLNAFVMIAIGNGGIYALTSPDLVTWSMATLVLAAPVPDAMAGSTNGPRNWYPTLMSPNEPSDEVTGRTGFLYYAKFLGDGTSHHYMYRQAFTIASSAPQSQQRK